MCLVHSHTLFVQIVHHFPLEDVYKRQVLDHQTARHALDNVHCGIGFRTLEVVATVEWTVFCELNFVRRGDQSVTGDTGLGAVSLGAVSYTHLDVYKRQK